jgi:hypothetical protein
MTRHVSWRKDHSDRLRAMVTRRVPLVSVAMIRDEPGPWEVQVAATIPQDSGRAYTFIRRYPQDDIPFEEIAATINLLGG